MPFILSGPWRPTVHPDTGQLAGEQPDCSPTTP